MEKTKRPKIWRVQQMFGIVHKIKGVGKLLV